MLLLFMEIHEILKKEIKSYQQETAEITEGCNFSQNKIVRRIALFEAQYYPNYPDRIDEQGDYVFWYDVILPRVDTEVKNIDFDTKDISFYSNKANDSTQLFVSNLALKEWLRDNDIADKLNEAVEQGSAWGNVVWKKIENGFELVDLKNFFVINQTAKTLEDTPVIERHILTQADLRAKKDVWENVDEVIKLCGQKNIAVFDTEKKTGEQREIPYYEIFERNGEINKKDLLEAQGGKGGNEDEYVFAKIITTGYQGKENKKSGEFILFAEEIKEMPYKEYHRGKYQGRWWRQGIYELLFDVQIRANEIGNEIARGLKWASKVIFYSADDLIAQNILTDLENGDIIKTESLGQIDVRMKGFDQLIADWNRLMETADRLCNSYEVTTGESLPSGTPYRLGALINQNANKLFDFIREKLGIAFKEIFNDWIKKDILKDIKAKDVLRLTGDSDYLEKFQKMLVNGWYIGNLLAFPAHSREQGQIIKQIKLEEIKEKSPETIKLEKDFFKDYSPSMSVIITGESANIVAEVETLSNFAAIEQDSIRRTALIELAMKKKNIDVASLPKTSPEMMQQALTAQPAQTRRAKAPADS